MIGAAGRPPAPRPNLIINGDVSIFQRGGQFTIGGVGATGGWAADRWQAYARSATDNLAVIIEPYAAGPPYPRVLRYLVNNANIPNDPNDYTGFQYVVEGYDFAEACFGAASAKPVTLSFVVNSSVPGTYGVTFVNAAYTRVFVAAYTINVANVWETKIITLPGCTDGVWETNNLRGLRIWWDYGSGTNTSKPASAAWQVNGGGLITGLTGGQKIFGAIGNRIHIGNMKLEIGGTATQFQPDLFSVNLGKCQRYFYRLLRGPGERIGILGFANSTTQSIFGLLFPVEMRAAPTFSITGSFSVNGFGSGVIPLTLTSIGNSPHDAVLGGAYSAFFNAGNAVMLYADQAGSTLRFDAEL